MPDLTPITTDPLVDVAKPKLKKPQLYKVILLNDDYTPMEFVVYVLQLVFSMQEQQATSVMLLVHQSGKGICGTFTREIAEMKVNDVLGVAKKYGHPLHCTMEPA